MKENFLFIEIDSFVLMYGGTIYIYNKNLFIFDERGFVLINKISINRILLTFM